MNKSFNKKAFTGWAYIVIAFLFLIAFLFVILLNDIAKVEVFDPAHELIHNLTLEATGDANSRYYTLQDEIYTEASQTTVPYNLILIFITGFIYATSIASAVKSRKKSIYGVLFHTLGGIIFLLYIFKLFIIGMIQYFEVEVVGYLFSDLIITYVPFYNTLIELSPFIILFWALSLEGSNHFFGEGDEQ